MRNKGFKKPLVSNIEKGKQRDRAIIDAIDETLALSREQIQQLFFKSDIKKCQLRLRILTNKKKLNRTRADCTDSYVYYTNRRPKYLDHRILCNWVYVSAFNQGFEILSWIPEYVTDYFVADAFCILTTQDKFIPVFIEFQRGNNHNDFDKVHKYTAHFESEDWIKSEWAKPIGGVIRYPQILVISDGKIDGLKARIDKDNHRGLRFKVQRLDNLNLEVLK